MLSFAGQAKYSKNEKAKIMPGLLNSLRSVASTCETPEPRRALQDFGLTAREVTAIRDELGVGIMDAKRIAKGRALLACLEATTTFDGLKLVLTQVVADLYPDPNR